ncbi:MAG TPA: DoxX family protein [Chitinophagaceae bacterium]|nr:DoxX family protein [Chitinophagaceae bacterium]
MGTTPARTFGVFFLRTLLGVIVLMQGWGKVFTWGLPKVYDMFFKEFEKTFIPNWVIWTSAYYTSYVELVAGILLITGLFKQVALYLLAFDLLIVSFGHGLMEPIWDLQHVIPRAILVATLLLLPEEWDTWRITSLIKSKRLEKI